MNADNLWWIISLCLIIFGSIGYVSGKLDGANLIIDKCNAQYELSNQLCDLECKLEDSVLDILEYYEKRCPEVKMDLSEMSNEEMLQEFEKYDSVDEDGEVKGIEVNKNV